MKAIMVMFDTLNRRMLEPYGCDWVKTPNFRRLAERTVTFDTSFVGSMPCMPARRELHTGRYNFLHRSWGPLEPFDDSMPQLLWDNGIHTHLITDHQHYWEDGGATYHNRYSTYEFHRGQEGDHWKARLSKDFDVPESNGTRYGHVFRQDFVNRTYMDDEADMPQAQTFTKGLEFLEGNHGEDNWFLQIETFDPHEPFFSSPRWKELYEHGWTGPVCDWPGYCKVSEPDEVVQHMRYEYAALVSMCDHYLGKVLDFMDAHQMWDDTLLIVNTDHGFLLGEHDHWAKCHIPFWNEIAHTPLFVWDPREGVAGERRQSLVQTIDLPATVLEYFGVERPEDMQGQPLRQVIRDDTPIREAALFGIHGGHVNVTDGRYVYMRGAADDDNRPLNNYTLMPTHMRCRFSIEQLTDIELAEPFSFTKGCPTIRSEAGGAWRWPQWRHLLYDCEEDPLQQEPLDAPAIEARMKAHLSRLMQESDAPLEQFERLGITASPIA